MSGERTHGGWFHCGRCGGLFREPLDGRCPECGKNPVIDAKEMAFLEAGRLASPEGFVPSAEVESRRPSKAGRSKGVVTFVVVWLALLGGVAGLVTWLRSGDQKEVSGPGLVDEVADLRFLQAASEECFYAMAQFLSSDSPEKRAYHVQDSIETLKKMVRFSESVPVLAEGAKARMTFFQSFPAPTGPGMQGMWVLPGGEILEAVFTQNPEEAWKLDWQQMVRFSEDSWETFLAGGGPQTAEFRVYARRRASSTGGQGGVSRLIFLAPQLWKPGMTGESSPEVQVDLDSELAEELRAAFKMRDEGVGVFGTRFHELDPKGMIRVRVVLHRLDEKDEHGEWSFELKELKACHWMSFDKLGTVHSERE
ncbi:MAG: hypothetical protein ACQKBU_00535 [Verrucomicrobiales bacterium]